MQELLITNIQRMSFHDGPGMRTTVFLKGCNLRCAWCHNPETQNPQPELIFRAQRCVRCGTCVHSCASGARTMGPEGPVRDTARCVGCGRCAQACLTGAIDVAGRRISCQELTELVLRDEKIFRTTAGGVTCSGGEPLLQADAVAELLGGMHARGLHTCVDTAGNVPWEAFEQVLPVTDLFLYDVKAYSPQTHRQWTGVGNERILENLRRLAARADIWIRIPFVPGVNTEQIEDIGRFLTQLPRVRRVEILPYHTLGAEKSAELNRVQRQFPVPDAAACETAEQTLRMLGLPVWIHLNMDYPFNLKGILYFPKINTEYDSIEGTIKLYNNQVFVADNIKEVIPEFLMLLKGVIDCPDLPLNVSRSALQNDGFVKKISDYITKKVADKS